MTIKINEALKIITLILGASTLHTHAQDAEPMSCHWQLTHQNEMGTFESQYCSHPMDPGAPDIVVANRAIIPSYGICNVERLHGYRTELKGTVQITGSTTLCYGHSVSFLPAPQKRIVEGVEEMLLECNWEQGQNNTHKLMCSNLQGQLNRVLVATKLQSGNSTACVLHFNRWALNYFEGGTVIVKEPSPTACDVDPVYFRPFPETRLIDGVEAVLLKCEWRGESNKFQVKQCLDVGAEGNEVAVAYRMNGVEESLLSSANRMLGNGQIIEAKELSQIYPPLYFKAN
ncbi:hypothetical protein [Pseudoalteromonas luteoviolacea]|uniref:Uncharacterized protein n=1 Tax=Pseudoalteromonas luteoviolacea NCIMB 1942 TaxID=1365253 RepID=A0A161XY12_9GAMM|nr:hypothetical protein [Pseudoalteromonas luteoviolacea]KZN58772.1 hypothetical protein N482_21445 [Pseudoalteromonas luteoviolacea NCIMB 1942]